jgi:hypothetical protein
MMRILSAEDCPQGSETWLRARMGRPSASEFKTVVAVKKDAKDKATRRTYMLKLAGEIITDEPGESYSNAHMERGKAMEAEARVTYAFENGVEPELVGIVLDDEAYAGCSPDSLIGKQGMLEIKSALPHILIDKLLRDEFPPEHKPQCQGNLWLAKREWIDIAVYWRGLPQFVKREHRDETYIEWLASGVKEFNAELFDVVERIRRLGGMAEAA